MVRGPSARTETKPGREIMKAGTIAAAAAVALWLGAGTALAADEIVIGAPVPLSGPAAAVGGFIEWGYKHAVEEVNAKGGISIDGKKMPIRLVLRDDKSDPNVSAGLVETLITHEHVVALLGSASPAIVNPDGLVAERHKTPMVTAADPLEAFKSVRDWKYVWDIFFDEPDLAAAPFKAMADFNLPTNKKVAILHDNGPDGTVVGGEVWPKLAKEFGFEVVINAQFPVDNTQFTSIIEEVRSKAPDIVMVDAITPQAILVRKQLAAAGYTPKILDIEKGAEPVQFATAVGKLSDGVIVGGFWDPSFPFPGAQQIWDAFEKETGRTGSQHIADTYAAAMVLLDAIAAANSLDPREINDAIAKTDKIYVVGPVKFDEKHGSKLPMTELQWQGGHTVVVWPKAQAKGQVLFPVPVQ
jgi:branched-chain amino acid transport system substrate-binding protein